MSALQYLGGLPHRGSLVDRIVHGKRRLRTVALGLALGSTLLAATARDGLDSLGPCGDARAAQQWVEGLNTRRNEAAPCGAGVNVAVLHWEQRLARSARELAESLAEQGALSHVDGAGRGLAQRLQVAGYRPAAAAENLAAGQPTFDAVLDAWTRSPAHCANLMRSDVTEVGIACVQRQDNPYRWFWVAQFGRPSMR